MNDKPEDLSGRIRWIIDDAIASLVAAGCSRDTALGLLVVQATIRMREREKVGEMRDFVNGWYADFVEDGDHE